MGQEWKEREYLICDGLRAGTKLTIILKKATTLVKC